MNEAITLAIQKGGYRQGHIYGFETDWRGEYAVLINDQAQRSGTITNDQIVLDPLFWQALGKALGWSGFKFYFEGKWQYTDDPAIQVQSRTPFVYETWLANALDYHKLILTVGDTEKFWKELLQQS